MTTAPRDPAGALDETGLKMVEILRNEGRISIRDLSERIGLAETTTRDRLNQMEREGYIRGYRPQLNYAMLGFPIQAWVEVRCRHAPQVVGRALARHPNVLAAHELPDKPAHLALRVTARTSQNLSHVLEDWCRQHDVRVEDMTLLDALEARPVELQEREREKDILATFKDSRS